MTTLYASQLATLLYLKPQEIKHEANGRLVRFDITPADPRFSSGPVQTRVLRYLIAHPQPITVGQLAAAVDTRCERVVVSLKHLIDLGKVITHQIDAETTEYVIKKPVWLTKV